MRKVLTKEEFAAKLRKEREERAKKIKPPKEFKLAGVSAYRRFVEIHSSAVYGAGYPDPKGYHQYFAPEMSAFDLGREARAALMASRFITPEHPEWDSVIRIPRSEEFKAWEEEDKARAGVKTLKALFNGAGNVGLRLQDGQIRLSPSRHRGRGHWEGIRGQEDTVLPEGVSDAELGAVIVELLEVSRAA